MKNQTKRLLEEKNCVELSEQDMEAVVGGVEAQTGICNAQPTSLFSGTAKDPNPPVTPVIPSGLCVPRG